jgi:hypothetical protein
MPTLELHYKLLEVSIRETSRTPEGIPLYTIKRTIQYFYDEAMTKIENEKIFINENVPYSPEWDSMLADLYSLPMNQ